MRLLYLSLQNYSNIYNALQRNFIEIDFSKCKSNITVIRSENGAGKTSIINELHPFISNSNVWMFDVDCVKKIKYLLDDNSILSITYHGWRSSNSKAKPSKCIIKRIYPDGTEIDLNPNYNINTGKDIISSLLDIDDNYITLSSLSANSKGIGIMRPSERKRFLSLIISYLDPFTKLNKQASLKYNETKALLQNINIKISQIGNIDIVNNNIIKLNKELSILEIKKENLINEKALIKTKLDDLQKEGNLQELYNNVLNEKNEAESNIKDFDNTILNVDENQINELDKKIIALEANYNFLDKELNDLLLEENLIIQNLNQYKIELDALFDKNLLQSLKDNLNKRKLELETYTTYFNKLGIKKYKDITKEEYLLVLDCIEYCNNEIISINNKYSYSIIENALDKKIEIVDYDSLIKSYDEKIDSIKEIIKNQKILKEQSSNYDMIPKDCVLKDQCVFVKSIVESKKLLLSDDEYNNILVQLDEFDKNRDELKKMNEMQSLTLDCINDIENLFKYVENMKKILVKFDNTELFINKDLLKNSILHSNYINIDLKQYRECSNYLTSIKLCNEDIIKYEEKIKEISYNNKKAWQLESNIENLTDKLNNIADKRLRLIKEIKTVSNELKENQLSLSTKKSDLLKKNLYIESSNKLKTLNDKANNLYNKLQEYNILSTRFSEVITELNTLNNTNIPMLKNQIEQSKYQIILYDQYKKDYIQYTDVFEKLETIKNDTSINGIQATIMKIQMEKMISLINQLANLMFGGRFILKGFNITENEFSIPVYDKETDGIRPDITYLSNSQLSQLSMIISLVLLYNSSQNYNIIRLDEVDNNLDNDNRFRFFNLINIIMNILKFDQCIMISHNYELDLSNCDIIITKIENSELYNSVLNSGGNIIANFMQN